MKNYVQKGQNLTLTAPRALNSGDATVAVKLTGQV